MVVNVFVAIYRFTIIVTVAVVETMVALSASEAIQLIQSTLQDRRIHLLPFLPHNVSFSGFQHINTLMFLS